MPSHAMWLGGTCALGPAVLTWPPAHHRAGLRPPGLSVWLQSSRPVQVVPATQMRWHAATKAVQRSMHAAAVSRTATTLDLDMPGNPQHGRPRDSGA